MNRNYLLTPIYDVATLTSELKWRPKPIIFGFIKSMKAFGFVTGIVVGVVFSTFSARANVYATDIKANGSLSTVTNYVANPVTITYRLNQPATPGRHGSSLARVRPSGDD